jgi:hypothetical protein
MNEYQKRSFLTNYLDYVKWQESSDDFHLMAALTILGAATNRKVYYDQIYYKLYCNLYTAIVAESAICRKGPPMDIAVGIFMEAFNNNNDYLIISGKPTPQSLLQIMSEAPNGAKVFLHLDELNRFFTGEMKNLGVTQLLLELYTCPAFKRDSTLSSGDRTLTDVFLNILGAGVPSWLQSNTKDIFEEGLLGRISFVHREKRKRLTSRISEVINLDEELYIRETLVEQLQKISEFKGSMDFTPEAGRIFDRWYEEIGTKETDIQCASGFIGRKQDHALKFAMLFSISKRPYSIDNVIDSDAIRAGIELAEDCGISLNRIFANIPKSETMKLLSLMEKVLSDRGKISKSLWFSMFYRQATNDQLTLIVLSLIQARVAYERREGRTTFFYYISPDLREEEIIDDKLILDDYEKGIEEKRWRKLTV